MSGRACARLQANTFLARTDSENRKMHRPVAGLADGVEGLSASLIARGIPRFGPVTSETPNAKT